jgi:hypothetical protein
MKTTILKRIRRAEVLAKDKSRAKQLARCKASHILRTQCPYVRT